MAERPRSSTILDVAARAGVSKSVVSRVVTGQGSVSEETRRRVLEAVTELDYVVNDSARSMVARRTHTVGAFVRDAATPFYGHLLTAMQDRAAAHGYRVVTATGSGSYAVDDERRGLETLVRLRVEGLVVCSGLLPVTDFLPLAQRVPVVVAGRPETHEAMTSVFCDEEGGGAGLVEHVLALGHRRVAVLRLGAEQSLTMAPRTAAMSRRLRAGGAEVVDIAGGRLDEVDPAVEEALAKGVTALMAPSDLYAVRVLEALQRRGLRAPEDLSVTGYDGIGALSTPLLGLTTWVQPVGDVGRRAIDALVAQLDGTRPEARHQSLPGSLSPGRTAGPVAG